MQSLTRRWLVIAAIAFAVLTAVAVALLLTYAMQEDEPLLISLAAVASATLLTGVAAVFGAARFLRARDRLRATRLRGVERQTAAAAEQASVARIEEHLARVEEHLARVEQRVATVPTLQAAAERMDMAISEVGSQVRELRAVTAPIQLAEEIIARLSAAERALERLDGGLAEARRRAEEQTKERDRGSEALVDRVAKLQRRLQATESVKAVAMIEGRVKKLEVRWAEAPSPRSVSRAAGVVDGFVALAEHQGLALADVVTRELAAYRVAAAGHGMEPLEAIPYLDAYPDVISELTNAELRALLRALRRVGYLRRALPLINELAARMGKPVDVETARIMASELALYRGELHAGLDLPPLEASPHPDVVLHIVGKALPATQSGYTLRTQYTVEAQASAGIRPIVVAQSGSGTDASEETQPYEHGGVPYVLLRGPERGRVPWGEWLTANVAALAEVVRETRPTVLHAHSDFINALIALPVSRAYGIPLVNETRGFWEESWLSRTAAAEGWGDLDAVAQRWGMPDMYRLRVEREAAARSQSDAVVTLARVMEQHIHEVAERLDLPVARVSIAPNAVDASGFDPAPPDAALREAVGLRPRSLVVGYVSSIVEYEGIDTLVRGVHALRLAMAPDAESSELSGPAAQLSGRDVQVLVVGDGPELEGLRALAEALGAEVIFTGRVPHERVRDYYALIDLFVVPRKRAAVTELVTPLKPFEAMAAGLPCLFSDVAALAEIAKDSGAAALFRADDPNDLAVRLAELLGDEELRRHMGDQGASWVRRERTWDVNAATYLELYRSLGLETTSREAALE